MNRHCLLSVSFFLTMIFSLQAAAMDESELNREEKTIYRALEIMENNHMFSSNELMLVARGCSSKEMKDSLAYPHVQNKWMHETCDRCVKAKNDFLGVMHVADYETLAREYAHEALLYNNGVQPLRVDDLNGNQRHLMSISLDNIDDHRREITQYEELYFERNVMHDPWRYVVAREWWEAAKNARELSLVYGENSDEGRRWLELHHIYSVLRLYERLRSGDEKGKIKALLGHFYRRGKVVTKNYQRALLLYEDGVKKNNREAQYGLGCLYYGGLGVECDREKAFELFKKAAEQGHLLAGALLGNQ